MSTTPYRLAEHPAKPPLGHAAGWPLSPAQCPPAQRARWYARFRPSPGALLRELVCATAALLLGSAALAQTVAQPGAPALASAFTLQYDGKGAEGTFLRYSGTGTLQWQRTGTGYLAQLDISAFGLRVVGWSSQGTVGAQGLEPLHFTDTRRDGAHSIDFRRDQAIIALDNGHDLQPMQNGAQDKLSVLLQLGALLAGAPARYPTGSHIAVQAADAQRVESWDFVVGASENLDLPGGRRSALHLSKGASAQNQQSVEVWLCPDMSYLPVRLRITEGNGSFTDLLWRATQNPS